MNCLRSNAPGGAINSCVISAKLEVLLASNPRMGVGVKRGIRKLLMPKFDHGIFYTIEGQRIMVAAVLDLRRDPGFIRARLGI